MYKVKGTTTFFVCFSEFGSIIYYYYINNNLDKYLLFKDLLYLYFQIPDFLLPEYFEKYSVNLHAWQ